MLKGNDILRTLAILGVVTIHVTSPLVNMAWIKHPEWWWIGNITNSLDRFAVPVFLMLSGATLLHKDINPLQFYRRRYTRVLLPFLFWIPLYWIFRWFMLNPVKQPRNPVDILIFIRDLALNEGFSKHFWYIWMILFLYLLFPFLGMAVRKMNIKTLFICLFFWMIILQFLQHIPLNPYGWSGNLHQKFFGYFLYTGYPVLGYFITRIPVISKTNRLRAAGIYMITVFVASCGVWWMSRGGRLNQSFHNYLHINTIIQSASVFIIFRDFTTRHRKMERIFNLLSDFSYGIYLSHIILIGSLFHAGIYWSFAHPLISLPVLITGVTAGSVLIIWVLRIIRNFFRNRKDVSPSQPGKQVQADIVQEKDPLSQ